jgi:hypothetical protein
MYTETIYATETEARTQALAKHLEADIEEAERVIDNYLILTDDEANKMAKQYIEDSICFFNASFIASHCDADISQEAIEAIQEKYEASNPILLKLIKDIDYFVEDAISSDGRGHFLSSYDGEESEQEVKGTTYFIYRTN